MTDIPGATSSTYTLVSADVGEQISVRVTATNSAGSASASSALTDPVIALYSPASLTGLIGWWDASVTASMSLTGSSINTVADQSGGGNTLTWHTNKPTYNATGFNGRPAFVFANVSSGAALRAATFPFGTGNTLTVFFAGQFTSSTNSYGRAVSYTAGSDDAGNAGSWLVSREAATTSVVLYRNGSTASRAFGSYGTPHRCVATISSSGVQTVYVDGVSTTGATLNAAFVSNGKLTIGNFVEGSQSPWDGPISEVGVATGFSDATVVGQLDNYLKTKWGL